MLAVYLYSSMFILLRHVLNVVKKVLILPRAIPPPDNLSIAEDSKISIPLKLIHHNMSKSIANNCRHFEYLISFEHRRT